MGTTDRAIWADMRASLWPDESLQAHEKAIDVLLVSKDAFGLIAETINGTAAGFAEIAIRKYANGCESQPVPFLEGIWVRAQFRRQGVGTHLVEHIQAVLVAQGFQEIGSDTQIDNTISQAAHLGWGFCETERVVYFRKSLSALDR